MPALEATNTRRRLPRQSHRRARGAQEDAAVRDTAALLQSAAAAVGLGTGAAGEPVYEGDAQIMDERRLFDSVADMITCAIKYYEQRDGGPTHLRSIYDFAVERGRIQRESLHWLRRRALYGSGVATTDILTLAGFGQVRTLTNNSHWKCQIRHSL